MIRGTVRRDGPACWSFAVHDDDGLLTLGDADTWAGALEELGKELRAFTPAGDAGDAGDAAIRRPPPAPMVCSRVRERSWLVRLLLGEAR